MADDLLVLLGVLTLGLLSPGPDFLLVAKNSLAGWRAGAASAAGIALGLIAHMMIVLAGLATLGAAAREEVVTSMRWLGAGALVLLGVRAWRAASSTASSVAESRFAWRGPFLEGLLCNLTNAKALVFFTALFVRVLPPTPDPVRTLLYGAVVVLHAWFCWTALAAALQWRPVMTVLRRHQQLLQRGFGAVLTALGASLALGV